jgi:hypothetical protein
MTITIKHRITGETLLTIDADSLQEANLREANLQGADLRGAIGNGAEVKHAHFDRWPMVWTAEKLWIGCQGHDLALWRKADPRWIAALDPDAAEWWARNRETVLALIGKGE